MYSPSKTVGLCIYTQCSIKALLEQVSASSWQPLLQNGSRAVQGTGLQPIATKFLPAHGPIIWHMGPSSSHASQAITTELILAYRLIIAMSIAETYTMCVRHAGELLDTLPPGVDEAVAISKVVQFLKNPEYSHFKHIVFDTAPTGHTLRLLTLPDFLDKTIGEDNIFILFLPRIVHICPQSYNRNVVECPPWVLPVQTHFGCTNRFWQCCLVRLCASP